MASLALTLAALATSAVPGLTAVAVRRHNPSGSDYSSAILTTTDDEVIVSVPRHSQAETAQSAAILGMTALSDGVRSALPFTAPHVLGITRAGETRAVAMTYLTGSRFTVRDLTEDARLLESIAESIAAIHALPRSIVRHTGLPDRSARDQRLAIARVVDRAAATRKLPETVHHRWTEVLEEAPLWDFAPCIVHGGLSDETLLVDEERISGVLGWSGFGVGDPASDLAWLLEAGAEVFEAALSHYLGAGGSGDAQALRSRAVLYHELEIARWLLHGVDAHDESVVDDAVGMLDRLVDRLSILASPLAGRETLDEAGAEELLERTPEVVDRLSDTAAYEALDEDRMFGVDTDFIEPLSREGSSEPTESSDSEEHDDSPDPEEQLTQPIADEDLPRA